MNTQGHGLFDIEEEGTELLRNIETAEHSRRTGAFWGKKECQNGENK